MFSIKRTTFYKLFFCLIITILLFFYGWSYYLEFTKQRTVADAIKSYGKDAESRIKPVFKKNSIKYPPEKICLIAFKDKNKMELWAINNSVSKLVKTYSIKAASGKPGPKLVEGDRQVPEGIYKIIGLNPNSSYHLSMKLNYPNKFDLIQAKAEKRESPGNNIFIHGKKVSAGCIALGDRAIEEIFTLVHKTGRRNVKVIITPADPDLGKLVIPNGSKKWVKTLYSNIDNEMKKFRKDPAILKQ